eukprot:1188878-Prorocentrum_minimum.AAC.1
MGWNTSGYFPGSICQHWWGRSLFRIAISTTRRAVRETVLRALAAEASSPVYALCTCGVDKQVLTHLRGKLAQHVDAVLKEQQPPQHRRNQRVTQQPLQQVEGAPAGDGRAQWHRVVRRIAQPGDGAWEDTSKALREWRRVSSDL